MKNTRLLGLCLATCFVSAAHADLVASWGFQGNLNSDIGGAALIGIDPASSNSYSTTTLYGQSRQVYNMVGAVGAGNNAGVQISSPSFLSNNSDYSLEVLFSEANTPNTDGWRKIYDNSGLTEDQGLYVSPGTGGAMDYYPHSSGALAIAPDTFYNVVMTFNATTDLTSIYVNGTLDSQTVGPEAGISNNSIPLSFFLDDANTNFGEYTNASVGLIRMWNTELGAGDVATIENNPFTGTPEPASMALLGLGVVGLLTRRRRSSV